MILAIFSVYDSKARAFLPPFYMPNKDVALRVYSECANAPSHHFCKYAEDFCLFEVGEFDDSTGVFLPFSVHVNHGLAANFKRLDDSVPFGDQCDEK